jgi:hypothetical protein
VSGLPRRRVLGLLGGGAVVLLAPAVRADTALDLRILQTASSLEALAEAAYARIPVEALAGFAAGASRRHSEHKKALQGRTAALGGRVQDAPNPTFAPFLAGADPVAAVTTIEKVLVDTYLANLSAIEDRQGKELVADAMAIAAQHLAVLRLASTHTLRLPLPLAELPRVPSTAGTVAPADGLHQAGQVADPASGALG